MELISIFITAIGGSVVALGIAAWLSRIWIKHRLKIGFAEYETRLAQKTEALKTELSIYAHEQSVGLTRIDAQRSEAVLSIWKILLDWQEVFFDLTAPNERVERNALQAVINYKQNAQRLMTFANDLSREVSQRAILFDQDVYSVISNCGHQITEVSANFYADTFEGITFDSPQQQAAHLPNVQRTRHELRNAVQAGVNELRDALVREFRRIMTAERQ